MLKPTLVNNKGPAGQLVDIFPSVASAAVSSGLRVPWEISEVPTQTGLIFEQLPTAFEHFFIYA